MVLLPKRVHPSVMRRNRLLELKSWSTYGGAVLCSDSNGLPDIIVDVVEILMIPFHSLNSLHYLLVNITSFIYEFKNNKYMNSQK